MDLVDCKDAVDFFKQNSVLLEPAHFPLTCLCSPNIAYLIKVF